MSDLSQEEVGMYHAISESKGRDFRRDVSRDRVLISEGNKFIESMETPFGILVMDYLSRKVNETNSEMIRCINGKKPIPESVRIEYKLVHVLVEEINNVLEERESTVQKIKRRIADFMGVDKPDNI